MRSFRPFATSSILPVAPCGLPRLFELLQEVLVLAHRRLDRGAWLDATGWDVASFVSASTMHCCTAIASSYSWVMKLRRPWICPWGIRSCETCRLGASPVSTAANSAQVTPRRQRLQRHDRTGTCQPMPPPGGHDDARSARHPGVVRRGGRRGSPPRPRVGRPATEGATRWGTRPYPHPPEGGSRSGALSVPSKCSKQRPVGRPSVPCSITADRTASRT